MEIGNQIKALRLRRGITQEAMAQHFGITAQAVSKWERGVATPDIGMLPGISAYFGVSIDELFALSDDTRMERIQNMIWDVRIFNPSEVENERQFLLEKARREPENDKVYELLANIELHLADEHKEIAAQYAKEALKRNPDNPDAHASLVTSMNGKCGVWFDTSHHLLINFYKEFVEAHPNIWRAYLWLMDHLLDAGRTAEANFYWEKFAKIDKTFRTPLYRGLICWYDGHREEAYRHWEEMQQQFSDDWHVWLEMGDIMVRNGEYEQAKTHYRHALELQEPPRYCDPLESIAQVCELQGDISGAIAALQEELALQEAEWHITAGETADIVRRNIARLKNCNTDIKEAMK